MTTITKTQFKPPNDDEKVILENHNPENYLKVILENYYIYNSSARADIAHLLHNELLEIRQKHPEYIAIQKNLFIEMYSKLIQISEDYALVALLLLKIRPIIDTYMESNNGHILGFYKKAKNGFSDKEIIKVLGLEKVYNLLRCTSGLKEVERKNITWVIDETIRIERENIIMLANIYLEKIASSDIGKYVQGGPIDLYNSIKHGFKMVHSTKLAKTLWRDVSDKSINIMHQVNHDVNSDKKIIRIGGFNYISDELIESIVHNIDVYSQTIKSICEFKLLADLNPFYVIKILRLIITRLKIKQQSIKHFEPCLCGSGIKYRNCCSLFENEYSNTDMIKLLNII